MTDAMGMASFISALSLVLAGRVHEVPPLGSPDDDILGTVGVPEDTGISEPYALASSRLSGFKAIRFGANFGWDMLREPAMTTHTVCLPPTVMKKLRVRAEAELNSDSIDGSSRFVSDGDILSAWGATLVMSYTPQRPAIIMNIINMRGRLPDVFKANDVFVQNLTFNTSVLLSPLEVAASTLGSVAAKVRSGLIQQGTEPQLRAIVKESRATYAATGNPPMFGDPTARLIVVTNWHKAKIFEALDFSPAVIETAASTKRDREVALGRLVYHHAQSLISKQPVRHFLNIVGKDLQGNYWMSGYLMPETWKKLEESLDAL
jgi:hypothetical protein